MSSEEIACRALEAGHRVPCHWIAEQIDLRKIPDIILRGAFSPLIVPGGGLLDHHCWQYLVARRREQRQERLSSTQEERRSWIQGAAPILENPLLAFRVPRVKYKLLLKQERGDATYLISAVYLIFNEIGRLVYVGQSRRLSHRLEQHLSLDGDAASLLRYVALDHGLLATHKCECGRKIECKRSFKVKSPAARELRRFVETKFEVAPISTPRGRLDDLEKMLQVALKPKYLG